MQLQCGGGNHAGDRAFHGPGDNRRLFLAGGQQDAATAVQNGTHAHRDRAMRHQVGLRKQRRVLCACHRRKNFHPCARTKRGQRLVETEMSVLADAKQLEINAAVLGNQPFVIGAFGRANPPPCRRADACSANQCSPAGTSDGSCNAGRNWHGCSTGRRIHRG